VFLKGEARFYVPARGGAPIFAISFLFSICFFAYEIKKNRT